uniref:Uncharacterized protein MANES_S087200 n=1 Tax=Rhizophora mucronata TaxID=61149 RepID=A0A2P2QLR9_RHIMU
MMCNLPLKLADSVDFLVISSYLIGFVLETF